MALETVLLALLGVVALWLAVDAGRERHRLRARVRRERAGSRPAPVRVGQRVEHAEPAHSTGAGWRYWPLTLPSADSHSAGPHL